MAEHSNRDEPRERELDIPLALAKQLADVKRRVTHLETLESKNPFTNLGTGSTLVIAGGIITVTESYHRVDTQSGAGTDNLDTINGGRNGDLLVLRTLDSGRVVTLRDGVDNLNLAGNFALTQVNDIITLINRGGSDWMEISRSDNA